jgi:hypothetical protein
MPTYETLTQKHADYDLPLLEELEDLYVGGYRILRKSQKYLTQLVGENEARYSERCVIASYQPYFGQVVDQFASALFGQPLDVKPAADASNPDTPGEVPEASIYHEFVRDCDRKGGTFLDLMKSVLVTALKKRCALVHLDFPDIADIPSNLAEEEKLGADRVYAYEEPLENLIDWEEDKNGLKWATLHKVDLPRSGPLAKRDTTVETFTIWTLDEGRAVWDRYQISYPKDGARPAPNTDVPKLDGGTTSFKRIPLLRLTLPIGLWVGNQIGPQAREHYNRRSSLIGSQSRSLCAIPYVGLGPQLGGEGSSLPADIVENQSRGNDPVAKFKRDGYLVLGSEDKVGFAEPLGHCYELVDRQLDKLKDAMFAVTHQMAASISGSSSTALGRSGLSKEKDQDSTAKVLGELGSKMRQFAALLYRTISEARDEDVIWTAHGLDDYDKVDRQQIIEESISLDQVAIPSETFKKHHKYQVARKLLGPSVDPVTLDTIKKEIEDGVEQEEVTRQLMAEAGTQEPAQNPTANGLTVPSPNVPIPEPGGATKDVGPSKSAKDAGTGAKPMGPSGQPLLPTNAHHQTGAHIDARTVYDMLKDDYKAKDIAWVLTASWMGPVEVPLNTIDFSNKDNWQASEDVDHVQHFVEAIGKEGFAKPIILVSNPSNDNKLIIVDGHHRGLAYLQLGMPPVAYVGSVGSDFGPWSAMHDSQKGSSQQSSSKQKSSQQK